MKQYEVDVIIIGGGVAGLWTLNTLRQQQCNAILLEPHALGHGQSIHAQGIIHGGLKYALHGQLTQDSEALKHIPKLWQDCLNGTGEIDLSTVKVLSPHQYLFAPASLTGKVVSFFASQSLASRASKVAKPEYPEIFKNPLFKGVIYQLNETVIDMPSLIKTLAEQQTSALYSAKDIKLKRSQDQIESVVCSIEQQPVTFKAKKYIFTAGQANQHYFPECAMQLRPLRMVAVTHPALPECYAHALGVGMTPRLTISTHGNTWYLGGQLAEEGALLSDEQVIMHAQQEMHKLFPWIEWQQAAWSSHLLQRAEASQANGKKPTRHSIQEIGNALLGWPTKMVFAPLLARDIAQKCKNLSSNNPLLTNHTPPIAQQFWQSSVQQGGI